MLKPQFTKADVRRMIEARKREIESKIIERLTYLGEMCVSKARSLPAEIGFTDRTGNLRSSIGYVVYVDGSSVAESFPGGEGEGVSAGKRTAAEVGAGTSGYVLVVVAGMEYATYVEAHGRDVLTTAESFAIENVNRMLRSIVRGGSI